ncbi:hypothetical protein K488DRAFT_37766, partial [Vararia minispora EC-137]
KSLFKVPRHLLVCHSSFFEDMFKLPQSDGDVVEGSSDEYPIDLVGTSSEELDVLFDFLYNGMYADHSPTIEAWINLLSIAHRLLFDRARARAIKEITMLQDSMDPFLLIQLSHKYDVREWILPASIRIAERPGLLEVKEMASIPIDLAVLVSRSREV